MPYCHLIRPCLQRPPQLQDDELMGYATKQRLKRNYCKPEATPMSHLLGFASALKEPLSCIIVSLMALILIFFGVLLLLWNLSFSILQALGGKLASCMNRLLNIFSAKPSGSMLLSKSSSGMILTRRFQKVSIWSRIYRSTASGRESSTYTFGTGRTS